MQINKLVYAAEVLSVLFLFLEWTIIGLDRPFTALRSIITSSTFSSLGNSNMVLSNIFSNMVTQSWSFKWKHSHTIDPSQHFNLDVHYVSENNFYQQDQVGFDVDTRLNQNMYSAIYYGKKWSNSNNSLSIRVYSSI